METKICSKCKKEKTIDNFSKKKEKYSYYCKDCNREYLKDYYNKMKNNKNYQAKRKKYMENYKRPQQSIERHKEKTREWRRNNKEHIKEYARNYDDEHREEKRQRDRKWRDNNRDKYREYQKKDLQRRMNDPILKVELQLRNMINTSFRRKGHTKNNKLEKIVGLNSKDMVNYLLETFKDNYGYEWNKIEPLHIDHIKPLSTANTEEEVIKLCHYTNLQLLKAKDNLEKGSKLNWALKEK